jgi:hypothetical protein
VTIGRVSRRAIVDLGLLHRGKTSFGMLKRMRGSCCVRPVLPPRSAFAGFRFPREVIVLAVRWYLRYGLSYRDVEELLAERGVQVDHVSIFRWVQHFTPLLIDAARPCRHAAGRLYPQFERSLTAWPLAVSGRVVCAVHTAPAIRLKSLT